MSSSSGLRLRKKPLNEVVQELDLFPKVPENVQEEKKVSGGAISVVSFLLISWLVMGELWYFMDRDYLYKFPVDTDYNETLILDVDLVIAMSCNLVGADVVDAADMAVSLEPDKRLTQSNTKFELTEKERHYWSVLQEAQKAQSMPGQSFKSLDHLTFVSYNVLRGLRKEADKKVAAQSKDGEDENEMGFPNGMKIIAPNGAVMEFFAIKLGGDVNDGGACRIHGRIPIAKVQGNVHITPGKTLPMGGGAHAHLNIFGSENDYNFSHRIERFSFGPRVSGLVTPLAGTEKISDSHMDLYQYYLKIVPTKVFSVAASLGWQEPIKTFQYSVTQRKRAIQHSEGSHGVPGLNFKYELSAFTVEVRESMHSFWQLLIRLCAVVGGIFATSGIVNSLVGVFMKSICGGVFGLNTNNKSADTVVPTSSTSIHTVSSGISTQAAADPGQTKVM